MGSTENCNAIEKKGELCLIRLEENFIHLTTVLSLLSSSFILQFQKPITNFF